VEYEEYLLLVLKTEISKPNAAELNNNIKIGSKCTFFYSINSGTI